MEQFSSHEDLEHVLKRAGSVLKNLGMKEIHVFLIDVQQSYIHIYIYRETELDSVSISLGWLSYYI